MNRILLVSLVLGCFSMSDVRAADDPKMIIERAIEAHGGEALLKRYPASVIKSTGKLQTDSGEFTFNASTRYQLPDRFFNRVEMTSKEFSFQIIQLINGDTIEMRLGDEKQKLTPQQKTELRQALFMQEVYQLFPLLTKKGLTLKLLPESPKVEDEETHTIQVAVEGGETFKMRFGKTSGLLVQVERQVLDVMNKPYTKLQSFVGHKKFNGLVLPSKIRTTNDGKRFMDAELDYQPSESLPATDFKIQ